MSKKDKPQIYSRFRLPPKVRQDPGDGPGADQSFKDECDIRQIMARARLTGSLIDPLELMRATRVAITEDMSVAPADFFEAQLYVQEANEAFKRLPASVRTRFDNDARRLIEFMADEGNRAEAIELGLLAKPARAADGPEAGGAPKGA